MKFLLPVLTCVACATVAFAEPADAPQFPLKVPKAAKVTAKNGQTTIETKTLWLYIWQVADVSTIEDALPRIAEVIKPEFHDFVVRSKSEIKLGGQTAVHLTGRGTEADDGDPGTAEVVIFAVGKRVFAACTHGEGDHAAREHDEMLAVLSTVTPR